MLASTVGEELNSVLGGLVDTTMKAIWAAAIAVLRGSFQLADSVSTVNVVNSDGGVGPASPIATIWPLMRGLSMAVALGLFFLQLISTMVRGGRGFLRLVTGPLAYGVAVAATAGFIGLMFAACDGVTTVILQQGLRADGFVGVLDSAAAQAVFSPAPSLGPVDPARDAGAAEVDSQLDATARAVTLGLVALFAVLPAAVCFLVEMVFRAAAFLVLVSASPITAAGLVAEATASWHWRSVRWSISAAVMKPALALVLVIGVNTLSRPTGVAGLLAGAGVLLVAVFSPLTVYRLLAFVEPGTAAGAALRMQLQSRGGSGGGADAAPDQGGGGGAEATHAARFDAAESGAGGAVGGGAGGGALAGGVAAGAALVAAAGRAASQVAGTTMDATGIGHPHGGAGGATQSLHGGGRPTTSGIVADGGADPSADDRGPAEDGGAVDASSPYREPGRHAVDDGAGPGFGNGAVASLAGGGGEDRDDRSGWRPPAGSGPGDAGPGVGGGGPGGYGPESTGPSS